MSTQENESNLGNATQPDCQATHEVTNQPPPLTGYNAFASDTPLIEALERDGGGWGAQRCHAFGSWAGGDMIEAGFAANENPPRLKTHDRYGHRIDEVEFHPAYHRVMAAAIKHELHALPWNEPRVGAHVVRSALGYMNSQFEAGHGCPITMTYAAIPALRHQPDVASIWEPLITSTEYDPRCLPAEQKNGATIGMGMTEKQGGSDVRSNTTKAYPAGKGGPGGDYELVGHKWFFSAPMCDAWLVLANAEQGISCFLVPKWRPDNHRNQVHIQRLKDKLGDRSNASSEVEFRGAYAQMIGAEGRGVLTIIDMVMHTRLDCMTGSAGLVRQAVAQAIHHANHREAFGKKLIDQPLMQNVLADLALESEAMLALMLRCSRAVDASHQGDEQEKTLARIATGIGKYWICKRTPVTVNEAQECLGGAGFVEESILPRLYRQAPLNSIWEGSGNIQCLDVLRAMDREPETVESFTAELWSAKGVNSLYDEHILQLLKQLGDRDNLEVRARRIVEDMALALQASVLIRAGNDTVSDAFCAARLQHNGLAFGTLPTSLDFAKIIDRAQPQI